MKFENASFEIEYLKGLDVVLLNSVEDPNLNSSITTKYDDDDFGL